MGDEMASIHREIVIDADPDDVWNALREWDAADKLAVGRVVECRRDGEARIVTLANGAVLREEILGCDDDNHRLAYSIVDGGPYTHHHASAEVRAEPGGRARFVWIVDFRPDSLRETAATSMAATLEAIKRTLERPRGAGDAIPTRVPIVTETWRRAFASLADFGAIAAPDVVLEGSIFQKPIVGREEVFRAILRVVSFYERLEFVHEAVHPDRTYMEWVATAFGFSISGMTVLTVDAHGWISQVALQHRPFGAVERLAGELREPLPS